MKEVKTKHGIYVVPQDVYDRSDDRTIIKALENTGDYQPWVDEWAKSYSRPSSVILDVGANIGSKVLPFSRLHEGKVWIVGFEPVGINNLILKELIRVNSLNNVQIRKVALSNSTGEMAINFPTSDSDLEAVKGQGQFNEINEENHGSERVEFMRLDDIDLSNISFIKVDIEGHELEFLEGATETILRESPAIVLELFNVTKRSVTKEQKAKNQKTLEKMKSLGYTKIAQKNKDALFIRK